MMERIGLQLGNYRLLHQIGQGGFADVYLGEHIYLNTQAAIKILHTQLTEDNMGGFRTEAQTIAQLRHPHIVRVLDFGVEHNTPYLVMDYAPKGTMRKLFPKGTQLPLAIIVPCVRQVAAALQFAHDQKLIHRDIKPENMLISANDEILLSDFGIATMAQSSHYQTQEIVGTISYMSPEQVQGKPRPASDQYALAIVVYEWLTGACPFRGTFTEVASQHIFAAPPPVRSLMPAISPDVEQVLMIALSKDPERRFMTVQAFARALEQTCGGEETLHVTLPATPYPETLVAAPYNTPLPTMPAQGNTPQPTMPAQGNTPPIAFAPPLEIPPPVALPPPVQPAAAAQKRPSRRAFLLAGLGAAVAVGGALALWEFTRGTHSGPIVHTTPTATSVPNPTPTGQPNPTATTEPPIQTLATFSNASQAPMFTASWSHANSAMLALGGADATIYVWQYVANSVVATYSTPASKIFHVAWSRDGRSIAAGMNDGHIQIWDTYSNSVSFDQKAHGGHYVNCVAWSPDGQSLVSGGGDGVAIVWNVAAQSQSFQYTLHTGPINAVAWSHDGSRIASGSDDQTVQVWDASNGGHLLTYTQHTDKVLALVWEPGNQSDQRVASASDDGTAQVWDAQSGQQYMVYRGHTGYVVSLDWSPDGALLASGGADATVQVWEATSGTWQRTYHGHASEIEGVAWSWDSANVASASDDGTVRVWPGQ